MDFNEIWYRIKKGAKRFWKKTKRLVKRYVRLLVRHTKAKDYSILIYTIAAVLVLILLFVLIGKAFHGKKKKAEPTTTEVVIATPTEATEDPVVTQQRMLAEQAEQIYNSSAGLTVLVNPTHPIESGYTFEHKTLNAGYDIDNRMYDDLISLSDAINAAGFEYNILGAYRDRETQENLLNSQIESFVNEEGLSEEEAKSKALLNIDEPGYSEHETGLAIDIASGDVTTRTDFDDTAPATQWLIANSYKYGFILRYAQDKTGVTGVNYKPWHFRYVGKEAATFLHDNNLSLEEFYSMIGR